MFSSDFLTSILHVKNIHSSESAEFPIDAPDFRVHFLFTMGSQLLIIETERNTHIMMSFASPENAMSDTPGERMIDLPDRLGSDTFIQQSAYGVLENKGVEILFVARKNQFDEMYCESYVMNSEWTTCESPPLIHYFKTCIVWQNRLVTLSRKTLHAYNHNTRDGEDDWSTKTSAPALGQSTFILNKKNHLCLDGTHQISTYNQVWCLQDIESTWIQMPPTYVVREDRMQLIGTLPAKIKAAMVTANIGQ